ncbi:MAG: rhodanese-like domain-containing protein [Candidatus Baltobacteraceae bacterium]
MMKKDEVTPAQAQTLVAKGAFLLDVRENDEWARGHVDGAHHIPLGELRSRMAELPANTEIVCMCRSGGRSAKAQALLEALPKKGTVYNLAGGILQWVKDGLPMSGTAEE